MKKTISLLAALCLLVSLALPAAAQPYAIDTLREYVMGVDAPVTLQDGSEAPAINFDNAATTPSFVPVFEEVQAQLLTYGSIGRGAGQKSAHSTEIFENARQTVLDFVGADPDTYTVFYANSTTDGLNKLASALITSEEAIVLASRMEHHANDLPWRHRGATLHAEVDALGRLDLADMERLLLENEGRVQYVTVTAASNVTGYVNDVHAIARLAHQHGAKLIVDAAQIIAHRAISMQGPTPEENIDFLVFSAHKMYAPYGSGAVVGLKADLDAHMPQFWGGGIVDLVSDETETYLDAPARYEAGSPNYLGVVAMAKAIEILQEVGFDEIEAHEQLLLRRMIDGLAAIEGVTLYGDTENISDKVGIVVFNVDGMYHGDVATELAQRQGIAVRHAAFCAHPYVFRLLGISDDWVTEWMAADDDDNRDMPGMVRASIGIYNTEEEVDLLIETVRAIAEDHRQ